MKYYSPSRKDKECFKKNTIIKKEDDGVLVSHVQKGEIIFEIKKTKSSIKKHSKESSFKKIINKITEGFYEWAKGFFNSEEREFTDKKSLYSE